MLDATRLLPRVPTRRRAYLNAGRAPIAAALLLPSYDPLFDIEGAFFPAWMLCMLVGMLIAFAARLLFARLGLEPHLGPLALVYSCVALLGGMSTWLLFFRV